jgi:hypothetical protein
MKPRPRAPDRPDSPGGRGPRDTLDDIDRYLDAVHERTEVDPLSEAPTGLLPGTREHDTEVLGSRELPTGPALGSREQPTGPAQNRAPWMQATPWVNPDAPAEGDKKDPWFLPVFVFVLVLLACIGLFLYQETHKVP